jgi:hypothetical protein
MKKVVLIAIIFFLVAMGIAGYLIFGRSPLTSNQEVVGNGENNSPFGTASDVSRNPNQPSSSTSHPGNPTVNTSALTRIYGDPVSGGFVASTVNGPVIRFTERSTGYIYEFPVATGVLQKISNTLIPKIYESVWVTASTTIFRYLNDAGSTIQTYSTKLVAPKTSSTTLLTLQGSFLPENIESLAVNPARTKIFYITQGSSGAQGTIANSDGTGKGAIFSSAVSEWNTTWPNANTITLTTKPSASVQGFLYFLTPGGGLTKILSNVNGLTTLTNPQGNLVAYSDTLMSLQLFNVKTGLTSLLSLRTIADKCVWSTKQPTILFCAVPTDTPLGSFPDSWYQGTATFSDEIYKIDTNANTSTKIGALKSGFNQDIDVTNLNLNSNEDYLIFMNKKDLSLWGLRLSTTTPASAH